MDPEYWGDPNTFRPSRFLTQDKLTGKVKVDKKEYFIPFGFGKRVCMGESLAKAELWLFVTGILQKVHVQLPKRHSVPDPNDDIAGLTRSPKPFYVNFVPRCQ
jgi:cytochrome P450